MSEERYHLSPLTADQLAGLQNAVCRVKVDLQRDVAISAARAANATRTGDAELELLAQDALRENRLKLESVMPALFSAQSTSQRRLAKAAASTEATPMITLIPNSECGGFVPSQYFHALVEFERDPLPPATPPESAGVAFGRTPPRTNPRLRRLFGAVPGIPDSPSGGGCAEEFPRSCSWNSPLLLSQLEPLERV